jgi:2-oxoisovalerate dehydrogenase E1 component alpha subunit
VDNQWAISTHRNIATGGATFASRGEAYHVPGMCVDGNDFLAVYAAGCWAMERAKRGGGPTLIELLTYRRDAHSTSDDPSQYRAPDEANHWPGGDPIDRLSRHLIRIGEWTENAHRDLNVALEQEVASTFQQAESFGTTATSLGHSTESLFGDVYAEVPANLQEQLNELNDSAAPPPDENPILSFEDEAHRAVG